MKKIEKNYARILKNLKRILCLPSKTLNWNENKEEYMIFDNLVKNEEFLKWHEYEPHEIQYARYAESNPSVIAAGHKIADVSYAFADARASFIYAYSEDFGNIAGSAERDKLYAKSHFLRYSVLEYALCLDMSWQVIWSYIQPTSFEYLMKQEYKELEKACTSEAVHQQLNCAIAQHALEAVVVDRRRKNCSRKYSIS